MPCGVCGNYGHNSKTCLYIAKRTRLATHIPKSKRCQCCGQYGYATQRHHTKARGDDSDFLDLCFDCHLRCGHNGNFQNLPTKPRVCKYSGNVSYWRR